MAQAPPILIYQPGGGVSSPIGSNPPVYSQQGTTALVEGQAYIDVVFGSIQTDEDWVLVACEVENTTDLEPLNIWPGIITDRTVAGFRLQLNGMPDSGNYYLNWAVSGVNIEPAQATTYTLSTTGAFVEGAVTFTVALPPSTFVTGSVIVTPSEVGLETGVFSPEFVTLTTSARTKTFDFIPSIYGDTTIGTTNDGGLLDPADVDITITAPTYTLTGPSSGDEDVESTDFTVALVGSAIGTVTVTPDDSSDGAFTPTTVELTADAPSDTFTYTPASAGAKTISVTNDAGLTDPASLIYTAEVPPFDPDSIAGLLAWWKADSIGGLGDGDPVLTWADSSGNGHTATGSNTGVPPGPQFQVSRYNGYPAISFIGTAAQNFTIASTIPSTVPFTVFAVMEWSVAGPSIFSLTGANTAGASGPGIYATGEQLGCGGGYYFFYGAADHAVHVYAWTTAAFYKDGVSQTFGTAGAGTASAFDTIGGPMLSNNSTGWIAEILIYDSELGTTDREDVEAYLADKYGI